jgi:hypothetical protein
MASVNSIIATQPNAINLAVLVTVLCRKVPDRISRSSEFHRIAAPISNGLPTSRSRIGHVHGFPAWPVWARIGCVPVDDCERVRNPFSCQHGRIG